MEPSIWARFAHFVKESYTGRIKQSSSGIIMGLITSNSLLFSGFMANLVGPAWWIAKGIGTVVLAFTTSLATSYGAYLIDKHKENQKKSPPERKSKRAA